jgi:hypothetical protein
VTWQFGELLRSIVKTIDQHGLKRQFLRSHRSDVELFLNTMEKALFISPVAATTARHLPPAIDADGFCPFPLIPPRCILKAYR